MRTKLFLVILISIGFKTTFASVFVYPGAIDTMKSVIYEVNVIQNNKIYQTFVYQDRNNSYQRGLTLSKFNHFCSFDFTDMVTIEIIKLTGDIGNATIHPLPFGIKPNIKGNKLSFTLNKCSQLFIKMEGMYDHPLFIFANPPQTDIPSKKDKSVLFLPAQNDSSFIAQTIAKNLDKKTIVFENGIHVIGRQFKVKRGTRYYISGGAIIYGTFLGGRQNHLKIDGRGIISGKIWTPLFGKKGIPFNSMNIGDSSVVQGIIIENSLHFALNSGCNMLIDNVKFFGWNYNNDGIEADENSIISNCFFKVQDDYIKMYCSKMTCENIVAYQQTNGAIFQLNWNRENGIISDCKAKNIYIVQSDITSESENKAGNRALVCMTLNPSDRIYENFLFENIYIDQNIPKLVGLRTNGGGVRNFLFKNISIGGGIISKNVFVTDSSAFINNIRFENLSIQNKCVETDTIVKLNKIGIGEMADIKYSCPSQK